MPRLCPKANGGDEIGVQLVNRAPQILTELKRQVSERVNAAAQLFVGEAQRNANVDTGFMKAHIGQTLAAVPDRLEAEVRSLAPYSLWQDTGRHGNLYWTTAYLRVREIFPQLILGKTQVSTTNQGIIRQALQDYHGPLGNPRGGKP